jgi:alpha-galactosidase
MRKFVDDIHALDMKVMLWFPVPFIGGEAKQFERFKDMLLCDTNISKNVYVFDPRYKEVRDYLIEIYANAVKKWNLDGLKLDFIDSFALNSEKALAYDEKRDYQSLEDAIDVLMIDITNRLREINQEILIEFRQSYVGPAIRKYGNMLRVGDCPNDCFRNRHNIVNLRLTSGKTAVHSDMVMWHYDDTVESAALQLVSIMYSVPQISVRIAKLSEEHKKMLDFYLHFWKENRETLIEGKLLAANPESGYSIVCSEKDGKAIFTSYTDIVVDCRAYNEVIALNSSRSNTLIMRGANGKKYTVLNCMGETVAEGVLDSELCEVNVPLAGMICIK